ncbi:SRPBCC family protein [Citricoccus sp. GCM10030269]|uniref:SRPBCC family protein n=1 Tax=Citricoccus sp. GCM10030269 TaxID=3273388 RepID=UPI003608B986
MSHQPETSPPSDSQPSETPSPESASSETVPDAQPAPHASPANPDTGVPTSAPQAGWPDPVDAGPRQVSYRIRVNAPAPELWELVANPHRHHELDGSHSVQYAKSGPSRLSEGDEFSIAMRKFGMPYTMNPVVTAAEEGTVMEWQQPGGHRWRWEFEAQGDGTTLVTETFDYSRTTPAVGRVYELLRRPQDNSKGIRASLTALGGRYL